MNYFREAYISYLEYLKDGGRRLHIPDEEHIEKPGYVSPSRLGFCPLAGALEKSGAKPVVPDAENGPAHLHRMFMGTNTGKFVQEAFVKTYDYAQVEVIKELETRSWWLRGKADVVVTDYTQGMTRHIFEIKNIAEAGQGRGKWYSIPQPGAVIQTLAYGLLFNTDLLHIITVSRNDVKLFDFFPANGGFTVQQTWALEFGPADRSVENTEVIAWDNPLNTLEWVNYDTVERLIEEHWAYLQGKRDVPYPDFLNHEQGWQCASKVSYPPKDDFEKRGRFAPRCPYFCHGDPQSNEFVRTEDGQWLRLQEAF